MIQLIYGLGTLLALWAFGGGNLETFWNRSPVLSVGLVAIAFGTLFYAKAFSYLKIQPRDLKIAVPAAVILSLLTLAIVFATQKFTSFAGDLEGWKNAPLLKVLLLAILAQSGAEIISRAFLQPAWGLNSVAFLDAVTVGFGLAHVVPFLVMGTAAFFLGKIAQKYSLMTAVVARCLWFLFFIFGLRLL